MSASSHPTTADGARTKGVIDERPSDGPARRHGEGLHDRVTALEGPGPAGRLSDEEVHARSRALVERMKELKCLYSVSGMLQMDHMRLGDILQRVVDVLPSAWQYPELASASIQWGSRRYQTQSFREPKWRQTASIPKNHEVVGSLELGYSEPLADGNAPDFLAEEQTLLVTVAERVGEIIALKEAESQLATYQERLRSLAAELTLAEERERRRLALILHDRISQGLAVAKLKLESLQSVLPVEHQIRLENIASLIKEIVNDTRSLTFEISPPILYELGLSQAVLWLSGYMDRQFGLAVEVHCDDLSSELPEGLRVTLFRSVQELLTNTVKHAQATRAVVRLLGDAEEVEIVVEDDGVGFDIDVRTRGRSTESGFGLFSIRERIGHLGGRMDIESQIGKGTLVRLVVPLANGGVMTRRDPANEDPTG